VIAKNQLILVVHIPLLGGDISMYGVVESHILPSSGLTTLPGGRFISCSRDKSVVEFSSSEYTTHTHACTRTHLCDVPIWEQQMRTVMLLT